MAERLEGTLGDDGRRIRAEVEHQLWIVGRSCGRFVLGALLLVLLVLGSSPVHAVVDLTTIQVNLNQVGYFPADEKIALVETNRDLISLGAVASVLTYPAKMPGPLPDVTIAIDRRLYGKFRHQYEVDFSTLATAGNWVIQVRNSAGGVLVESPPTSVSASPFAPLIDLALRFFGVQRCGNTAPLIHSACHTTDGTAVGGPSDGMPVDMSGGWHDAGDFIKFASSISYATFLQLFAIRELAPPGFSPTQRTAIRDEARKGVEWLLRAHPTADTFYFVVGDGQDHDAPWRMPESDTAYPGPRPAYYGLGANLAGRTAAALALCAQEWAVDAPALAASCRTAAMEIYALGKTIGSGAATDPKFQLIVSCVETAADYAANQLNCSFYPEDSWADDMALGAVALFELTGTASYLNDAQSYADTAGAAYTPIGWSSVNDLALYLLHGNVPASGGGFDQLHVSIILQQDVDRVVDRATLERYNAAEKRYLWGSSASLAGDAITCILRDKLAGDPTCRKVARWQLDFLLGRNPFGASMLAGAGTVYPLNPHHNVAVLRPADWYAPGAVIGSLAGGPACRCRGGYNFRSDPDLKVAVLGDTASPFAPFQSTRFMYHDIREDYVSNEPALDYNANLIALLVAFSPP